jgi:hypothetical protein
VVPRWPGLSLVTTTGGRDAPHAGAARLPVVASAMVGHSRGPLKALLVPLLPPLMPSQSLWVATLDDAPSPLLGVTSLLL